MLKWRKRKGAYAVAKKILISSISFFGFYLLGMVIYPILTVLIDEVLYSALSVWFPEVFTRYNIVTERELYFAQKENLAFISAIISITVITYLSVRFDNERYEAIAVRSEGMYRIKEGVALYLPAYAACDAAVSVITPLIFFGASLIPVFDKMPDGSPFSAKKLGSVRDFIFSMNDAVTDKVGLVWGILLIIAVSAIAHLLIVPSVLKKWRAIWLSDIV